MLQLYRCPSPVYKCILISRLAVSLHSTSLLEERSGLYQCLRGFLCHRESFIAASLMLYAGVCLTASHVPFGSKPTARPTAEDSQCNTLCATKEQVCRLMCLHACRLHHFGSQPSTRAAHANEAEQMKYTPYCA